MGDSNAGDTSVAAEEWSKKPSTCLYGITPLLAQKSVESTQGMPPCWPG